MNELLAVLIGAISALAGSLIAHRLQWQKEERARWDEHRRSTYPAFLKKGLDLVGAIERLALTVRLESQLVIRDQSQIGLGGEPIESVRERLEVERANVDVLHAELTMLSFEVSLLSQGPVRAEAAKIRDLRLVAEELFSAEGVKQVLDIKKQIRADWSILQDQFLQAARTELRIVDGKTSN